MSSDIEVEVEDNFYLSRRKGPRNAKKLGSGYQGRILPLPKASNARLRNSHDLVRSSRPISAKRNGAVGVHTRDGGCPANPNIH